MKPLRGRRRRQPPAPQSSDTQGLAFGWRVHDAIQGWTATVDIKASIVIAVETAVTGAAGGELITSHGELHGATGLHLAAAVTALAALAAAVGCGLWVVFPRLHRRDADRAASGGLIYFGHLRKRDAEDIAEALRRLTPGEERLQVARQLRVTGNVAWLKHAWLQTSIVLFAIGMALFVTSLVAW